ncbi:hypothetical protein MAR_024095, partial [Mya arenaria]
MYYPGYIYYEEGAYQIKTEAGTTVLIVSPDGSLNNGKDTVSIEIKCPFAAYTGSTPVFYHVKPRHIVQCHLESHVLHANEQLYLSWSKDTTTVFRMRPNDDLVKVIVDAVEKTYHGKYPTVPTKTTDMSKMLKQAVSEESEKAEFLGEFQSVFAAQCTGFPDLNSNANASYEKRPEATEQQIQSLSLERICQFLLKGLNQMTEAYVFQKPIASEVQVYLMSDMDRSWNREIGLGLPITYLFKGYSLTMAAARQVLEEVLNACYKCKAHVPCVCFDGQFARLKYFDLKDQPLTLFALQQKPGFLEVDKKCKLVQNRNGRCLPIETALIKLTVNPNHTDEKVDHSINEAELIDESGLEQEVVSVLEHINAEPGNANSKGDESTSRSNLPNTDNQTRLQLDKNDYNVLCLMLRNAKRQKLKN